jgi:hypothetical protein
LPFKPLLISDLRFFSETMMHSVRLLPNDYKLQGRPMKKSA